MVSDAISSLAGHKYINLETYRKNGEAVATPIWFAADGEKILIVTRSQTGKIKRLQANKSVRFMPCGFKGEPKGEWIKGRAAFCSPEELRRAVELRNKKYGLQARLVGVLSRSKGELVAFSIIPE